MDLGPKLACSTYVFSLPRALFRHLPRSEHVSGQERAFPPHLVHEERSNKALESCCRESITRRRAVSDLRTTRMLFYEPKNDVRQRRSCFRLD